MKKITIALFTVIALASCTGTPDTTEAETCVDTTKVATDTTAVTTPTADTAKVAK